MTTAVGYTIGPPADALPTIDEDGVLRALNNAVEFSLRMVYGKGEGNILPTIEAALDHARWFGSPVEDGYTVFKITVEKVEG